VRPDLTVIMSLRDAEPWLARHTRALVQTIRGMTNGDGEPLAFEILALDQRSRDNTLAVLSLLSAKIEPLAAFQDVPPGTAILRAARLARGDVWLIVDRDADLELTRWAIEEVLRGHRAATVPAELLAVHRAVATTALGWSRGGLVTAQREVRRTLSRRGETPVVHPARGRGLAGRIRRFVRARASRLGLPGLDRPMLGP
jgi:hypothetical protein